MGTAADVVSIPGTLLNSNLAGTGNRCLYVDASGNVSVKSYDCRSAADGDNLGNHSATQNIKLNTFWLSGDGGNEGVYVNSAGGVGVNADSIAAGLSLLVSGNLQSTGSVTFSGPIYAGAGNRMITVDNAGVLGAAAIPTDTDIYWTGTTGGGFNATTARTSLGLGSLATLSSVANAQITDVAWSKITGFPAACSAGQYVSAVGGTLTCSTPTGGVSGSGTTNYVSKWTAGSALGNSIIYDNGNYVGIGTSVPGTYKLNVAGTSNLGGNLTTTGTVSLTGPVFTGAGNRMITVDNAGVLGAAAIPTDTDIYWTGTATNLVPATARTSLGLGSLATLSSVANAQITDVAWSKITGFPAACSAGQYVSAVGGTLTCSTPAGGISGSGTANYVSKWTGASALGNSNIYDGGTNVGIGTTAPEDLLNIKGDNSNIRISSATLNTGTLGLLFDYYPANNTQQKTGIFTTPTGGYGRANMYFSLNSAADSTNVNPTTDAKLTILNSGNVGIGTTNPDSMLVVRKDNNSAILGEYPSFTVSNLNTSGGAYSAAYFRSGTVVKSGLSGFVGRFYSYADNNINQEFVIETADNTYPLHFGSGLSSNTMTILDSKVGIGTKAPVVKLDVRGDASNTINATTAVSKIIGYVNNSSVGLYTGSLAGTPNYSTWIQSMREVDQLASFLLLNPSGGNVGIGTSTPSYNLQVNSSASFASNNAIFDTLGNLSAPSFTDKDNAIFKLDPSDTTTSLAVAGNINSSGGNLNIGGTGSNFLVGPLFASNALVELNSDVDGGNIKIHSAAETANTKIDSASIKIGAGYYSFQPYLQINHVDGEPFLKLNNGTDNVFTMAANCPTEIMVGVGAGSDRNKTMCQSGGGRIFIGNNAGYSLTTGVKNVAVGNESLHDVMSASGNTAIGEKALYTNKSNNNVAIGTEAGRDTNGSGNIFIGYLAGANAGAVNNTLYIDNSDTNTPLISGNFSTDALQINGSLNVTGSYSANGNTGYSGVIYVRNKTNTGSCSIVVTGGLVISHNCP